MSGAASGDPALAPLPAPGRPSVARALVLRFGLVLLLVGLDQLTKWLVFRWLGPGPSVVEGLRYDIHRHVRYPLLGDHIALMLSRNPGAAFGRFGDYPYLLVGGRVLAVLLLSWILVRAERRDRLGTVAVALVLAGALGNLIDNLCPAFREPGYPFGLVRDFIDVWFRSEAWGWDYHFPTFNVADSCITVGAVLWILSGLLHHEHAGEEAEATAPGPPEGEGEDGQEGRDAAPRDAGGA